MHVLASALTKLPVHLHVARLKEGAIDAIKIGLVDATQCKDLKFLENADCCVQSSRRCACCVRVLVFACAWARACPSAALREARLPPGPQPRISASTRGV